MDVVDRHGWADGMTIQSFGKHIGFRTDEPEVLRRIPDLLPPGWAPSDRAEVRRLYSIRYGRERGRRRQQHVLYMNAQRIARSPEMDWILERLESDLQLYVADRAERRIFVHAGVVGHGGKAIVLPGPTMTGKTTLVRELLRQGATYYSDEYAVLSDSGRVYPFAKRLSVRVPGGFERAARIDPLAEGVPVGEKALPVGLVAFAPYVEGATFRPRSLAGGKAVLALLEHTVPARRRPRRSLRVLERVVRSAVVLKGRRGDAERAAAYLLRRLG